MERIGYALVNADNQILQTWGSTLGQSEGVPDVITLPNGDRVHGAKEGDVFKPSPLETLTSSIEGEEGEIIETYEMLVSEERNFGELRLLPRFGVGGAANTNEVHSDHVLTTFAVHASAVAAERDRRLAGGFEFDFEDARGVHRIGTTPQDMQGWAEVTTASQAALALGQPNEPLAIVTDTGPVSITALEWQKILMAATRFRQPIWAAAFALQAMAPIPADFENDGYWP